MSKTVIVSYRGRLTDIDLENLEPTESVSWLSRTQCGRIYTVKGVPSSELDILLVDRTDEIPADHVAVIELGKKEGKYGGLRSRLTVRYYPPHQAPSCCVAVWFVLQGNIAEVHVGDHMTVFGRYEHILNTDNDLKHIVRWHYSRYYQMLSESDVESVEANFCNLVTQTEHTLAEANRLASRLLYRSARDSGYRKLTKREQLRLGMSGQWHSESEYATAQAAYSNGKFHASGTSEYSREISRGERPCPRLD
jgi:hypothetical protein